MRQTVFSPDRRHRYTLWRQWGSGNLAAADALFGIFGMKREHADDEYVQFIALNPSTADEVKNDNTVTRMIGYAKYWGFQALCVTNIFAYRATDPKVMKAQPDPTGEENDRWIKKIADGAKLIVAAWGKDGAFLNRGKVVCDMLDGKLHCLSVNKDFSPCHPLYLKKRLHPNPYRP